MFERWSPGYGARQRFLFPVILVYITGKRHLVGLGMNDDLFEAILTHKTIFFSFSLLSFQYIETYKHSLASAVMIRKSA